MKEPDATIDTSGKHVRIGDNVRVVKCKFGQHDHSVGKVVRLDCRGNNNVDVMLVDGSSCLAKRVEIINTKSRKEAEMSDTRTFKVGDKVRTIHGRWKDRVGKVTGVIRECGTYRVTIDGLAGLWFDTTDIVTIEKTFNTLEEGDILINDDGEERVVLGICGRIIFLSCVDDVDVASDGNYTAEQLQDYGYKIKSATENIVEVTISELSKKHFGGKVVKIIEE